MPYIQEIADSGIVKYDKNSLYCSWQEKVGKPGEGLFTRSMCFLCNVVTGDWNKDFVAGTLCIDHKNKAKWEEQEVYAKANQQGEH